MKMKILMVAGNPYVRFRNLGVSLLAALAKEKGHQFKLFDMSIYQFEVRSEHEIGEERLEYKKVSNPERMPKIEKKPISSLNADFLEVINSYKPDLIGYSCSSMDYPLGRKLFNEVKEKIKDIPVFVGGVHPTVDPENVIKEDWVSMINVGQGEESFIELLDMLESKKPDFSIKNIWFKVDGKIIKNPVRPFIVDLNKLPYPDWSIYEDYHFYRPFNGFIHRYGAMEISRGCPGFCKFCINSKLIDLYGSKRFSIKSVERAISELEYLKKKYNLDFIRFLDENFLLKTDEYLEKFAKEYKEKINLPFIISCTGISVTEKKAKILKEMNCVNVGIGVETSNQRIRREVLNKHDSTNEDYKRAFKLLNAQGIRTAAQIMIGLPTQTIEDVRDTFKFLQECEAGVVHVAFLYPFRGTKIREEALLSGLLDKEKVEEYEEGHLLGTKIVPTLFNFPKDHVKELEHYFKYSMLYREIPYWLWDIIKECDKNKDFEILLRNVVSKKRFGN
jgi:anaerobic magnesium-protoporphyrin IX monomethyl ester cyclase